MWPFLYLPGDRLSVAELSAARIDGDVVEVGEAYMPADAIETCELRAASFRPVAGAHRAVTRSSAAWIHGAIDAPPAVMTLQRAARHRPAVPVDARIRFRDVAVGTADLVVISGVHVTTPVRTLVDLVRDAVAGAGATAPVDDMLRWRPGLLEDALAWMDRSGPVHHKRAAAAELRRRQEEVTR